MHTKIPQMSMRLSTARNTGRFVLGSVLDAEVFIEVLFNLPTHDCQDRINKFECFKLILSCTEFVFLL